MNDPSHIPTGPAAAAIVSAGLGCFLNGFFFLLEDAAPAAKAFFNFYPPAGALSGTSTAAVALWLAAWLILARLWRGKDVNMRMANAAGFALLVASLLFTFPPFIDLLQGK